MQIFRTIQWSIILVFLIWSMPGFAKKQEPKQINDTPTKPSARQARSAKDTEQLTMSHLEAALIEEDSAHWLPEKGDDGKRTLLISSPATGQRELGHLLILAKPGTYPYQARWYSSLRQTLTEKGWQLLSIGLQPTPIKPSLTRAIALDLKDKKRAEINTEQEKKFTIQAEQWLKNARRRHQLLTQFSSENNQSDQAILIAVGQSADVAYALAANKGLEPLTGLVLINLAPIVLKRDQALEEKMSQIQPVLEILTSPNPQQLRAARQRKNQAIQAGNQNYRLMIAPAGTLLNQPRQSWLSTTIHGWAMTR